MFLRKRTILEFCCDEDSEMGMTCGDRQHRLIRLMHSMDMLFGLAEAICYVEETEEPVVVSAIPCTPWAKFQRLNLNNPRVAEETKKRILLQRMQTRRFLRNLYFLGEAVEKKGGKIVFEWPTGVDGWELQEVKDIQARFGMEKVKVDGCTLGVCADGVVTKPIKKPWTIMTNVEELKEDLEGRRCPGNHVHVKCQGKYTKGTGHYPKKMVHLFHQSFERFWLKRDEEEVPGK